MTTAHTAFVGNYAVTVERKGKARAAVMPVAERLIDGKRIGKGSFYAFGEAFGFGVGGIGDTPQRAIVDLARGHRHAVTSCVAA